MALQDQQISSQDLPILGMDDSFQETEAPFFHAKGVAPYYNDMVQRILGKKRVDVNPGNQVMSIAQAFNGFGQYGYFVQTDKKLYFHRCEEIVDMHINFTPPLQLQVDDSTDRTLDMFGKYYDRPARDSTVSCVFEFPDKPVPPELATGFKLDTAKVWPYIQNWGNFDLGGPGATTYRGMRLYRVTGSLHDSYPAVPTYVLDTTPVYDFEVDVDYALDGILDFTDKIRDFAGFQRFIWFIWWHNTEYESIYGSGHIYNGRADYPHFSIDTNYPEDSCRLGAIEPGNGFGVNEARYPADAAFNQGVSPPYSDFVDLLEIDDCETTHATLTMLPNWMPP
jgi:hypothetical protein